MSRYTIHTGDCREVLRDYPDNHFDSIVSDPPYGLTFMGKGWDKGVPSVEFWLEMLRVAKPGAHLVAFGGTRAYHRLTCAIEDAGWEVRDCLMWLYGTGFPKSHDVSKAIDREAGAEREVVSTTPAGNGPLKRGHVNSSGGGLSIGTERSPEVKVTAPATEAAKQWEGWGTALKPAWEPVILARKPLEGTVAATVLKYGTGALNIDACRVEEGGRWPSNLVTDDSDEVLAGFPNEEGRFFYCAKASTKDRDEGLDHLPEVAAAGLPMRSADGERGGEGLDGTSTDRLTKRRNTHPTVKPTSLMQYLCRLVTPPNGVVLDPFCGSGSTGKAAMLEGFRFVGIDLDPAYATIANARCEHAAKKSHTEKLTDTESASIVQLNLLDGL
jgi:DNA modification methylase